MANKIEALGGGTFGCFDDTGICVMTCCCPCIQWGQSMEDAGMGSMLVNCLLITCVPCWNPVMTAMQTQDVDKRLGGPGDNLMGSLVCYCCCGPCAMCQLARAVKKGKEQGLLKAGGAPAEEEMAK
jgi:Cys-rich protein (TIGR01571 family)